MTSYQPLADKLRPSVLEDMVGQDHILGGDGVVSKLLQVGHVSSMILWGPPGSGKTTIAKIIASKINAKFIMVSAINNGTADLRKIFLEAEDNSKNGIKTILLVDEIHRFNRTQQDLFLPYVENGNIILLGATTENPSFEINSALLSRSKVVVLKSLDEEALAKLILRAENYYQKPIKLSDKAKIDICKMADGDGRFLLSMCEEVFALGDTKILDTNDLYKLFNKRFPLYDKNHDGHYNLISALHKSLRGSDVNAALYWFSRMLDGGEDPNYILRRLVRFAVEDIGMADPNALTQAIAAREAYNFLGSPEGDLAISQAVIYLATAPKSNAAYIAHKAALKDAKKGSFMPPKHILNAPTKLMRDEGYSENYIYDHDTKDGFSGQNYFPSQMSRKNYYQPLQRGFEREIEKRLLYWQKLREKNNLNK